MAKTLAQLEAQIAKLQQEAQALRAKEIEGVVQRIREAIEHYGLTPQELFGQGAVAPARGARKGRAAAPAGAAEAPAAPTPAPARRAAKSRRAGQPVPVKYRDGAGNTWTGRGSTPRWLKAALAAGQSLEDFAVKG